MEKPKFEDFDLDKNKISFCEKFKKEIEDKVSGCVNKVLILAYLLIVFILSIGYSFFEKESYWFWTIIVSAYFSIFVFMFGPIFLANKLGKKIGYSLIKNKKEYKNYLKIKNNLEKYNIEIQKYEDYLKELKKKKSREAIDERLNWLSVFKKQIFNKKLSEVKEDWGFFCDTLNVLRNERWNMNWNEKNFFDDFDKYRESRQKQLEKSLRNTLAKRKNILSNKKVNLKNKEKEQKIRVENLESIEPVKSNNFRNFLGKKVDFKKINLQNSSFGLAAEKFIFEYEKEELTKKGKNNLAKKIKHISVSCGDGTGYDLLSFFENGDKKYIEVKATRKSKNTSFLMTQNEIEFMKQNVDNYFIYRIFDFDMNTGDCGLIVIGAEEILAKFILEPTQYKIKLKS